MVKREFIQQIYLAILLREFMFPLMFPWNWYNLVPAPSPMFYITHVDYYLCHVGHQQTKSISTDLARTSIAFRVRPRVDSEIALWCIFVCQLAFKVPQSWVWGIMLLEYYEPFCLQNGHGFQPIRVGFSGVLFFSQFKWLHIMKTAIFEAPNHQTPFSTAWYLVFLWSASKACSWPWPSISSTKSYTPKYKNTLFTDLGIDPKHCLFILYRSIYGYVDYSRSPIPEILWTWVNHLSSLYIKNPSTGNMTHCLHV